MRGQGQKRMSKYRLPPDLDILPPSSPTSHDPSSSPSLPPIVPDFAGLGQEPKSYKSAVTGPEADLWMKAIESELASLKSNDTWEEVDHVLPNA